MLIIYFFWDVYLRIILKVLLTFNFNYLSTFILDFLILTFKLILSN